MARYLEGVLVLGFVLGPHCVTGWLLRRRLVPAWRGATAVLAGWIATDPGLQQILETNGAFVYQIDPTQPFVRC